MLNRLCHFTLVPPLDRFHRSFVLIASVEAFRSPLKYARSDTSESLTGFLQFNQTGLLTFVYLFAKSLPDVAPNIGFEALPPHSKVRIVPSVALFANRIDQLLL